MRFSRGSREEGGGVIGDEDVGVEEEREGDGVVSCDWREASVWRRTRLSWRASERAVDEDGFVMAENWEAATEGVVGVVTTELAV